VVAQISHVMARARRTGKEAVEASDAEAAGTAVVVGRGQGLAGEEEGDSDEDSGLEEEEAEEEFDVAGAATASGGSSMDGDHPQQKQQQQQRGGARSAAAAAAAGAGAAAGATGGRRRRRVHGGPVTFKCCFCVPLHFRTARKLYGFLKRSVTQAMVTRPVFLALSAMCEYGTTRAAQGGVRLFRVFALAVLVYAVLTIARVYHLVRRQIWAAFNPVSAFMVVKGFILVITVQVGRSVGHATCFCVYATHTHAHTHLPSSTRTKQNRRYYRFPPIHQHPIPQSPNPHRTSSWPSSSRRATRTTASPPRARR
jgi:hypothetical protein